MHPTMCLANQWSPNSRSVFDLFIFSSFNLRFTELSLADTWTQNLSLQNSFSLLLFRLSIPSGLPFFKLTAFMPEVRTSPPPIYSTILFISLKAGLVLHTLPVQHQIFENKAGSGPATAAVFIDFFCPHDTNTLDRNLMTI